MKKTLCILLAVLMMASMFGCSSTGSNTAATPAATAAATEAPAATAAATDAATAAFKDSADREVELPSEITRIAPSGAVATMILATLAPEKMVCIGNELTDAQKAYLPESLSSLPVTGQLYGSKSTLNAEELLKADPQVIIDLGDPKDSIGDDLDALQQQVGVPCIYVRADIEYMAEAYRTLGKLLGCEDRAEKIASFIDQTVSMAKENAAKITDADRVSVMYGSGETGLDTNAKGSIQAQVLDLIGADNAIVVDDVSNKGGGNTINMEQLYKFAPDVILFAAGGPYATVGTDSAWTQLDAIKNGKYYEIPGAPYNWLSGPPSVNMVLGVWWLGNLLYPDVYDYDMTDMAKQMYSLFWNHDLTDDEITALLGNSTMKVAGEASATPAATLKPAA